MAKTIILEYPDSAPYERIRDDIDTLLRGAGGRVAAPVVTADDETDDGSALIAHLGEAGYPAEAGTRGAVLASNQMVITDDVEYVVGAATFIPSIENGVLIDFSV